MPETVPRWLLAAAGVVALITILIGVKDFAERNNAVSSPAATASPAVVPPDRKSAPKTTVKKKAAGGSAKAVNDSAEETFPAAAPEKFPATGGIVQASERTPFAVQDEVKKEQLEPIEGKRKTGRPRCAPLPNSTKPEDVDALYYQNWAKEYGCGDD